MRTLLKAIVPNRALVAARFALNPNIQNIPLVCVPSVIDLMNRVVTDYGYGLAMKEQAPVDASGRPVPWYTYPMIEYLDSFDFSEFRVFEYGCGNSTLWWAAQAKEVFAVEDNREWFERVSVTLPPNGNLTLQEDPSEYVNSIDGMFDIIVVDGTNRYECCVKAVNHLTKGGAIVLDNADCLPKSTEFLRSAGLFEIAMNGFSASSSRGGRTSLFISQPCRFKPRPHRPSIGGVHDKWDCQAIQG